MMQKVMKEIGSWGAPDACEADGNCLEMINRVGKKAKFSNTEVQDQDHPQLVSG